MYRFLLALVTFGLALPSAVGGANAQSPAPDAGGDLLAQGPLAITVRRSSSLGKDREEKGNLFSLTKKQLIYYPENASRPVVLVPGKNDRVRVESRDPKAGWTFDPAQGVFAGQALPPEPIDIKPVAFDREAESRYLFFVLEQLQEQTDSAIKLENTRAVKACVQRASDLAAHMRQKKLAPELIQQFEMLAAYAKAQEEVFQRGRELFQKAYKEADKLARAEAEIRARRDSAAALGLLQAFVSAIPTTEFYSVDRLSGTVVEHQSMDMSGVASGLGTMMQSQMSYGQEQARLNAAKTTFAKQTADEYQKLQRQLDDRRRDRANALRDLGTRRFQLPKTDLVEQQEEVAQLLRKTKDYTTLTDLLTQRAQMVRGKAANDNPYLLVEIHTLKSHKPLTDVKKQAEETFGLAKQCVAAAKLLPEGTVYDGHRREVLKAAADLAAQAAALEVGSQPSAEAYNLKALYALRLLDLIGTFGVADLGGDLRELRARALLQVGRKEEALQQAVEIEELRKQSPTFQYHLARLYCANNRPKEGLRCLEDAIRRGFRDIRAARSSGDLAPLRKDKRFANLTQVNAETKVAFPRATFGKASQKGNNVEVTNRSPFALTGVRLRLEVQAGGLRPQTYHHVLDGPILPNEAYTWKDAFAIELKQRPTAALTIESDQGTVKVLPTARY